MSSSKFGFRGSLENVERSTEAETKAMKDSGRLHFLNKTTEDMLTIQYSQVVEGHETMTAAAEEIYLVEGTPQI